MLAAVASPTRRPVNGPGPSPATIAARSPGRTPASAKVAAISGANFSPCARGSTVRRSATPTSPSAVTSTNAAVDAEVAVSRASTSTCVTLALDPRIPVDHRPAAVGERLVRRAERAGAAEALRVERAGVTRLQHDVCGVGDQGGLLARVSAPEQEDHAFVASVEGPDGGVGEGFPAFARMRGRGAGAHR